MGDELQNITSDITQLNGCCDHDHSTNESPDVCSDHNTVESNHSESHTDGWNKNNHPEAQSEYYSDQKENRRKDKHTGPPSR
jgi:hypothetical protein